jgi:hypothetical protein
VNLGIQLLDDHDDPVQLDFMRVGVPGPDLAPDGRAVLRVEIPLSADVRRVRLDMVSEHVAWFGQLGRCQRIDVALVDL